MPQTIGSSRPKFGLKNKKQKQTRGSKYETYIAIDVYIRYQETVRS